jgi:hypothetical protein
VRQLADRPWPGEQLLQQGAPRGIGDDVEGTAGIHGYI